MEALTQMPNIGKTLAQKLIHAHISSPQMLRTMGAQQAFVKLATIDNTACLNMLYALEGAIQDIRWHNLPQETKEELKHFYHHYSASSKL